MSYDLDTPAGRYHAVEALGPEAYNAAVRAHMDANTVATVNGYAIRRVSSRWGNIYMVDGTGKGWASAARAKSEAAALPTRCP
jgi:hypothetical protein